ncbi:CynX/NimT family MFS transporter [Pseudomonas sp. ZM23]|uniref:CynX/NimT family MFS transporter n=1 Tax=Pseudomonas triclosanedens TaxID=2961893 RepID=A0ABY7A6T4_9PSED|nr:CynX/NimT family MFS transporter [Pseudomonas triclosanedens]MCP8465780.1 CynX/NimT family MFS transporter [Pseudomonas triclosanedens]MCP8471275.1 CynX/NimT family MFS transporter [Pseudomonas triclosanedens]MCP8477079.1 CynX/NimT family MFS transporter [Pseudomonas triclosanedens]WAI51813.1 CynX/NimT family MFS transporter [Pseudomonas triclosanedens]
MSHSLAAEAEGAARTGWVGLLVIVALGINLRPILTSIGPLLTDIREATGLGFQGASMLTVLPVLCMGLFALALPWIGPRLGESRGMVGGLLAIGAACFWRLLLDSGMALIASAVLAGTGVAIIQALIPGVIKRWFPHKVPSAMGLYSASLMAGGGSAAVLAPVVSEHFQRWQDGLGAWLLLALVGLLLWAVARPRETPVAAPARQAVQHYFGSRRAWLLATYFGLINGGYTSMVAWLPVYYRQLGWSAQGSGRLIGLMTIFQVIAALTIPLLIRRSPDRRGWLCVCLLIQLAGFVGLICAPLNLSGVWVALIGYGLGSCFALSLTLTLDHLPDAGAAGRLAAFVQGIGFIITGVVPYVTGWLRDSTGSFQASWVLLAVSVVMMLGVTVRFSPKGYTRAMAR